MRPFSIQILGAALAAMLCTAPAAAQELERPNGWMSRFDNPGASEADVEMFVEMPPGWHVTTGPAGIFYHPENTASGEFRAEMEVFLFDPQERREAFGIFIGGSDLQDATQEYTYFLLRDGGQYIIKRRVAADAPTVQPWTSHDAVRSYADRGDEASIKNVLVVEAGAAEVRFLVNDREVAKVPRSEVKPNGIFGFRVNHGLNVHISKLEVRPLR